jgi:surface protein
MFSGFWENDDVSHFNGDISGWNVSNVKNMSYMFCYSPFTGDISRWNVSNVTDMRCMFWGSAFSGNISQWDISHVIRMTGMFGNSQFRGDISRWDASKVINMRNMFEESALEKENCLPTWYAERGARRSLDYSRPSYCTCCNFDFSRMF